MDVVMKPELRTIGGETTSIYFNGEWAGDLYLIYREGDSMTGTIQIDTRRVDEEQLEHVTDEVRTYIHHLGSALNVQDSSVVMMYGDISSIVEMEPIDIADEEDADLLLDEEDIYEAEGFEEDFQITAAEEADLLYDDDQGYIIDGALADEEPFHLSVVFQDGEHTKYQLHDEEHRTYGLVSVDEIGSNVSGRVDLWSDMDEDETTDVARCLAREFSETDAECISFTMNYQDEHVGDFQLERRDLM